MKNSASLLKKTTFGHFFALITVFLWGTTFISTKILLNSFSPVEILFYRFILALIVLNFLQKANKSRRKATFKQEVMFALAGLTGICLYFLFENMALTYTLAANVAVINSIAPFFTSILAFLLLKNKEKMHSNFILGFILAFLGICLISFNGSQINLNPKGDILALLSALVWAFYSIVMKKIGSYGFSTIFITQKTFIYGLFFIIPVMYFYNFNFGLERFLNPVNIGHILFLGIGASALCFAFWAKAVKILGVIKSSVYIYLIPVLTVITAYFFLNEPVSFIEIIGIILTLIGLIVSENLLFNKK